MTDKQWELIVRWMLEWTDKHCGNWDYKRAETLREDLKIAVEQAIKETSDYEGGCK